MYAIVKTGGKQYKVAEGDVLKIEKLNAEVDEKVELNQVLMIGGGDNVSVGTPLLDGASVTVKVLSHGKAPKVISFNYKPKKRVRVKKGHRQLFTEVKVESIKA